MTLGEWAQVRVAITLAWENARQLTDDELDAQFRLFPVLAKISAQNAVRAVVEIASTAACESCRSGPRFAPGPGEIIARVQSWPLTAEQIIEAEERHRLERLAQVERVLAHNRGELSA